MVDHLWASSFPPMAFIILSSQTKDSILLTLLYGKTEEDGGNFPAVVNQATAKVQSPPTHNSFNFHILSSPHQLFLQLQEIPN